jgi:hypothetical protein
MMVNWLLDDARSKKKMSVQEIRLLVGLFLLLYMGVCSY